MKKNISWLRNHYFPFVSSIFLVLSSALISISLFAQQRRLTYDVIKNGKIIGRVIFLEVIKEDRKFLSFNSNIKTSFIFSFSDKTLETSTFENEIMVHASLLQEQTGSDKTNSVLELAGNGYKYNDGGKAKVIAGYPINFSTLLLYVKPPQNITQVYSQKFQKFLPVKKISENKYRLTFPDGKYNDYTYNNGTCSKVDVVRRLFNIEFVLREQQ